MAKLGLQYKYPWIYKAFIKITHTRPVLKEFNRQVGTHASVFDIAAGFGLVATHIDKSNSYTGIDLNDAYIKHAKQHGRNVRRGDILDAKQYAPHDVFTLVDIVHHLPHDKLTELFDLVFHHAKKRVVILEPAFVNLEDKYGKIARPIDWLFKKIDSDGVNTIERWLTEDEYTRLFQNKFSSAHGKPFEVRVKKIFPYYIVSYTRVN